jgi:23S rRNA (adenine2503-C2)-methyltransferase
MAMAAQPLPLFLWWSRAASSSLRARFPAATRRRLYSALRRPVTARCEAGSKVLLKGMDYPELEVRALDLWPI